MPTREQELEDALRALYNEAEVLILTFDRDDLFNPMTLAKVREVLTTQVPLDLPPMHKVPCTCDDPKDSQPDDVPCSCCGAEVGKPCRPAPERCPHCDGPLLRGQDSTQWCGWCRRTMEAKDA